ncbi:MAG: HAMP domain-containing protein, partial [Myxococcaceae bacterium]
MQKGMTQTQVSGVSGQISLSDAARAAPANLEGVRGLKLEQVLLLSTTLLVILIAGLGGWATAVNTQRQFTDTAQLYRTRFEEQTRELGATVTHTLSLASSASLRDNNYSFITETVRAVIANNPNVVRVRVLDAEGLTVADTYPKHPVGTQDARPHVRSWATATYGSKLVFEYQEPIDYGSSAGQGLVVLGYSLDALQQELGELERNKAQALQANTVRTVVLGVFFVVLAAVYAAFQSRRISRPLAALTLRAQQLGEGDLEARVSTSHISGREVSTLSVVFNHMADRIQWLMEDVKQKAVLEREMQLARAVQETLLPSRDVVTAGPLRIAGACMPADAC